MKKPLAIMAATLFSLNIFSTAAGAAQYKIDSSHSKVGFEVSHLVISTVEGRFKDVSGSFEYDEKKKSLKNEFNSWKKDFSQNDDVLIFGIKLNTLNI